MEPAPVVEDLDELEDRRPGGSPGREGGAVHELSLEGGEEALGDGVVPALAGTRERLKPWCLSRSAKVSAGVLAAAVGMGG